VTLRIVFMGTPDFAVPTLSEIVGQGHEVVAVYTRAPKPGGRRGLDLVPSPVQLLAERFALPVFTPKTLRDPDAQAQFAAAVHEQRGGDGIGGLVERGVQRAQAFQLLAALGAAGQVLLHLLFFVEAQLAVKQERQLGLDLVAGHTNSPSAARIFCVARNKQFFAASSLVPRTSPMARRRIP